MTDLLVNFASVQQLYQAYMPFLRTGGLFVATSQTFHLGDKVHLSYQLPTETNLYEVSGKVVWINPQGASSGRPVGVGVLFMSNADVHKANIEKHLTAELASSHLTSTI